MLSTEISTIKATIGIVDCQKWEALIDSIFSRDDNDWCFEIQETRRVEII